MNNFMSVISILTLASYKHREQSKSDNASPHSVMLQIRLYPWAYQSRNPIWYSLNILKPLWYLEVSKASRALRVKCIEFVLGPSRSLAPDSRVFECTPCILGQPNALTSPWAHPSGVVREPHGQVLIPGGRPGKANFLLRTLRWCAVLTFGSTASARQDGAEIQVISGPFKSTQGKLKTLD